MSLASYLITFLSPLGKLMGLDGTMLTAFLFGIPANEIVLPLALMMYSCGSVLVSDYSFSSVLTILTSSGWTHITALCAIIFSLMHWPCSTTLMTIKKESKSLKWTVVSFLLRRVIYPIAAKNYTLKRHPLHQTAYLPHGGSTVPATTTA
jgi:ferrous iron transport protein B